jgi:hypothetical protein
MAERPAGNPSVRCAASRSRKIICERSRRGSPTAIMIATPIIVKAQSRPSKIMRQRHTQRSPDRGTERSASFRGKQRPRLRPRPRLISNRSHHQGSTVDYSVAPSHDVFSWRHGNEFVLHCRVWRRMIERLAAVDSDIASDGTFREYRIELDRRRIWSENSAA